MAKTRDALAAVEANRENLAGHSARQTVGRATFGASTTPR